MKKLFTSVFLLIFVGASPLLAAETVESDEILNSESQGNSEFFDNYISGKLQIGTRMVYRSLTDDDSGNKYGHDGDGTYLGTIYALDEIQDYVPNKFFLGYYFSKYVGIELAYDNIQAETLATSTGSKSIKSDGDVILSGPTVSIIGRYPTSTPFTPYVSVGVGFYSGDFDEEAHWALGYHSSTDYIAAGSPTTAYNGNTRKMEVDDAVGLLLGAGCTYNFNAHWLLDFSALYTTADPDATFQGYSDGVANNTTVDGHFPMDNFALRLGIAYQF